MDNTNSVEMQIKLLGAYIENPDIFNKTEHLIRSSLFTTSVYKKSYEIIKAYHNKGIKPDISIIYQNLTKLGFSKSDAVQASSFGGKYLSESQATEYVEVLFSDYITIYLTNTFHNAITGLLKADPITEMIKVKDAITSVELALNNVAKDKSIKIQFDEAIARIKGLKSGEIERAGFSWGVPSLDEKTMGIVQGINVIAGDKGCGKSSLVINIIRHNALENQIPVLFFSLEMTAVEVLTNLIANVRLINSKALRTGQVDAEEISSIELMRHKLGENFVIDETGGITWEYCETKIRAFRKKNKVPYSQTLLVILDYLQIMKNSSGESRMSKEEKIEQINNELMRLGKNENIALVMLSQFSREGSKRGNDMYIKTDEDKLRALRPRMGDLKGSSAIESNAISILLLFRPEYYQIYEANGRNLRGLCEINIVKGRYVSPEPLYVKFNGKYNLFSDYEEEGIKTDAEEAF